MDEKQVRKPATLGPVAEGQLELNRELTRRAPEASRDRLLQEQESLQRAQPDVVHEAAARSAGRQDVTAAPPAPGAASAAGAGPADVREAPEGQAPEGQAPEGLEPAASSEADVAAPGAEPAVRSPFADAAVATRDPRSDAG